LRRSLALLGLTGLLPITVLSVASAFLTLNAERDTIVRRAELRSQFTATLISRELASQLRSIRMVSLSPAFDGDRFDTARFDLLAARLIQDEPTWRILSLGNPEGVRLHDVPEPVGGRSGGAVVEPRSFREAVLSRKAVVGDVVRGPRGALAFAVRAPVVRGGRVSFVISAVVPAAAFQRIILDRNLPADWRLTVQDSSGRDVIASGIRTEGEVRSFPAVVEGTGWRVKVDVPARAFSRLTRQSEAVLAGGASLALALFGLMIWLLVRELRSFRAREASVAHAQRLEAMGRLTGGVAHDLNNLLTPVLSGLDLLRRRVGEDERSHLLIDNAVLSAERAAKLVSRLLTFSRQQPFVPVPIDMVQLFAQLQDLLVQALGAEHRLIVAVAADAPLALTDRDTLELTIMNLVVNARDASPKGGEVELDGRRAAPGETVGLAPGDYVAISVIDHGHGMDETTVRRAREPFFSTKAVGEGTGLGLSMAHGFCEQSGGRLMLASTVGVGTKVTMVLPADRARDS
jgi:signal transduction histidine kinase